MSPTEPLPQESAVSLQSTDNQLPTEFLEQPVIDLIGRDLASLSENELDVLIARLRDLNQKPGALKRALTDEAVALREKKPRAASKAKINVSDLL